ncbi:MAG: hypothetical protein WCN81_04500 [Actinomycetes bacterium]
MRVRRVTRGFVAPGLILAAALWLSLFAAFPSGAPAAEAASLKGVVDWQLEQNPAYSPPIDATTADQIIAQITGGSAVAPGLHASWTRVLVYWDGLQPEAPGAGSATYDQAYVGELRLIVSKLTAAHVNVIVTPTSVPRWASDRRLWASPPTGFPSGYGPWFAIALRKPQVVAAFQGMMTYLAQQLGPLGATRFEVWNEPNLSRSLYPQRRGTHGDYGLRVYDAMLRACWSGIKSVDKSYTVIAGATSPAGNNSTGSTSPISWARYLKKHGMASYFDAYSHHPYTLTASVNPAPGQQPDDPRHMVTLANLSSLLKIFPTKPFYLTEYGYATGYNPHFGYQVSRAVQAAYLEKAFAMAASHTQVKALIWYAMRDWAPDPRRPGPDGVYTGLMTLHGGLKPSWRVFARMH